MENLILSVKHMISICHIELKACQTEIHVASTYLQNYYNFLQLSHVNKK